MENHAALEQQLDTARLVLEVLERQAAGYTALTIPVHLQVQLEQKRKEVQSLEERLAQLGGQGNQVINNVPRPHSIFVGRQVAVTRCLDALSPEERGWGVTIDGIGGIGKTALALEVAQQAQQQAGFDAYLFVSAKTTWLSPDGAREETLAHSSLDAFVREFARLLGDEALSGITDLTARRAALLDTLRGRRVLLIWDNLETLTAEERDMIAEFLRKLPGANKAIITSRRRTGESALTIRLDRLTLAEAEQLMMEVGQRQPRVLQEVIQNTPTLRLKLYEAVGGNPLALHWLLGLVAQKGYGLVDALERLQDPAHSADLYNFLFADAARDLAESDRTVLAALATFQTPATTAALVDVSGLNKHQVEVALERLVTLSLVNDLDSAGYGLHPLTRTYVYAALTTELQHSSLARKGKGGVRLDATSHRKALRYWVDFAKQNGGDSKNFARYPMLDAQWPNLEAAAAALRDIAGVTEATGEGSSLHDVEATRLLNELASALAQFLLFRGYWSEGVRLGTWAYAANLALGAWSGAGWCAYSIAFTYYSRGKTEKAAIWADRSARTMTRGGTRHDRASATQLQGLIAHQRKQWDVATRFYQTALVAFSELGTQEDLASIYNDLGEVARAQCAYDQANEYYRQALALSEKIGDVEGQAVYTGNLGILALDRSLPAEACRWYEQQLALAQQIGYQVPIASAQAGLAQVLESEGRYSEALALAQAALRIRQQLGHCDLVWTYDLVERLCEKAR